MYNAVFTQEMLHLDQQTFITFYKREETKTIMCKRVLFIIFTKQKKKKEMRLSSRYDSCHPVT